MRDGAVVGAVGVCGGHADQDEIVGRAAVETFDKIVTA